MKLEVSQIKKSLLEALDKVRAENNHTARQVKHILDYMTTLDVKVEDLKTTESHLQSKASTMHVRELSP